MPPHCSLSLAQVPGVPVGTGAGVGVGAGGPEEPSAPFLVEATAAYGVDDYEKLRQRNEQLESTIQNVTYATAFVNEEGSDGVDEKGKHKATGKRKLFLGAVSFFVLALVVIVVILARTGGDGNSSSTTTGSSAGGKLLDGSPGENGASTENPTSSPTSSPETIYQYTIEQERKGRKMRYEVQSVGLKMFSPLDADPNPSCG